MLNSGLPSAKLSQQSVRFGNTVIKTEKPSQSFDDAKKGIDNLEKAAKERVFTSSEPSE